MESLLPITSPIISPLICHYLQSSVVTLAPSPYTVHQLHPFSLLPQEYLLFKASLDTFITATAICLCDILRMETVDTFQTSGQSQKYFPAQLVDIIIHELFGPACLFSSDSHSAEAAGLQGLYCATRSTAQFKDSCRQEGVHRVNISQSLRTGQSLLEVKNRFYAIPCFYVINNLRKNPTNGTSTVLICVSILTEKT